MKTKIIYEDRQILVVHKPAGIATETARIGQQDVASELRGYLARSGQDKPPLLRMIHRLDQPVEGLLVFAKTKAAAGELSRQLQEGALNKQYYAVVCGQPSATEGELVDSLIKTEGVARVVTGREAQVGNAKRAVLQYRVLQTQTDVEGKNISLVDIHIDTGRFHQIRVQMAHAGFPLLGDLKYGTEESMALSRAWNVRNVALCAYQLEFTHPRTGKKLSFSIEPQESPFDTFSFH